MVADRDAPSVSCGKRAELFLPMGRIFVKLEPRKLIENAVTLDGDGGGDALGQRAFRIREGWSSHKENGASALGVRNNHFTSATLRSASAKF